MTDNEIIKALEICLTLTIGDYTACQKCPYKGKCGEGDGQVLRDTLGLINRQKAEIERLESKVNRLKQYDEERDIRLHARLTATARAEAFKEFAKRLLDKYDIWTDSDVTEYQYVAELVNNLVKEMTEGKHDI